MPTFSLKWSVCFCVYFAAQGHWTLSSLLNNHPVRCNLKCVLERELVEASCVFPPLFQNHVRELDQTFYVGLCCLLLSFYTEVASVWICNFYYSFFYYYITKSSMIAFGEKGTWGGEPHYLLHVLYAHLHEYLWFTGLPVWTLSHIAQPSDENYLFIICLLQWSK